MEKQYVALDFNRIGAGLYIEFTYRTAIVSSLDNDFLTNYDLLGLVLEPIELGFKQGKYSDKKLNILYDKKELAFFDLKGDYVNEKDRVAVLVNSHSLFSRSYNNLNRGELPSGFRIIPLKINEFKELNHSALERIVELETKDGSPEQVIKSDYLFFEDFVSGLEGFSEISLIYAPDIEEMKSIIEGLPNSIKMDVVAGFFTKPL
jgi:hypothetical protein